MAKLTVQLDEELARIVAQRVTDIPHRLAELSVLELYRQRHISSGKAATLLGMERFEFVRHASRLGIPFFELDDEQLEKDAKLLATHRRRKK